MRRLLTVSLLWAAACTTVGTMPDGALQTAEEQVTARCRLIGPLSGLGDHDPRNPVLDETKTAGPTRVIWLNPPSSTLIKTEDDLVYRCDARL